MPYIDGKRVSNEEWMNRYGSLKTLHTGPSGENPAPAPDIDEEIGAPTERPSKKKSTRSKRSSAAAKAAIADALGVKEGSSELADIDVTGLDAEVEEAE